MIIDHPAPGSEPLLRRLWKDTFEDTEAFLDAFFRTAYAPDRCLCVLEEQRLVGAVYWFDCRCDREKLAYIYALAVDKACRGRGIGRALMEKVHGVLEARGYAGALLVPQEEGLRAMYVRLGYREGPQLREFVCEAADTHPVLRRLTARDYAAARRKYLPEGGVVQEGEGLAFLETQAAFWAGEDCILAARQEGEALFGLELLGNAQSAPGMLGVLGCARGIFRVPGEGRFALFHPLGDRNITPGYFAFAFD